MPDTPAPDWPGARLHIVTGKGGTGKTTVAAALAITLAYGGRRTLLLEVEGRQGIAQLFDCPPLPYRETRVATAPGGGEVQALAVDDEAALLDYLDMFYNLRRAGRALRKMGAIDFATAIAPGLRDVLLTGKVKEATTRTAGGKRVYDAVVLDAPPTGRITKFLNVTAEVSGLAKVGPIKTQSDGVMAVLRSSQTAVHIVTLLEEMPVQETIDAITELTATGIPVGAVFVNAARASLLSPADQNRAMAGRLGVSRVATGLKLAGLDAKVLAKRLTAEAVEHAQRVGVQDESRERIGELELPTYELPLLPGPIDLADLFELADILRKGGVA
ncbi:MAG: ArsA-related P-loop ATPase [Geodermatophilaceae bacterium]|jgi:anion-transporting  ArsA/GET3 family ATPase|nr:ATPase [Geodermatophilaceae bacterium]